MMSDQLQSVRHAASGRAGGRTGAADKRARAWTEQLTTEPRDLRVRRPSSFPKIVGSLNITGDPTPPSRSLLIC